MGGGGRAGEGTRRRVLLIGAQGMSFRDDKKVVWVLGAGFSRSLGGPLLDTLLTETAWNDVELRYGRTVAPQLHGQATLMARLLYAYGRGWPDGYKFKRKEYADLPGEKMWRHAEEYLDYLDAALPSDGAKAPSAAHDRLSVLIRRLHVPAYGSSAPDVQEVRNAARRLLAAEVCAFLEPKVNTTLEKWAPYRTWAAKVMQTDTIVTFNYDLVVEKVNHPSGPPVVANSSDLRALPSKDGAVLKLHGSVDWSLDQTTTPPMASKTREDEFAVRCLDDQLAIATPGASKQRLMAAFEPLWQRALDDIMNADAIVFVGYSFPPTDANARQRLLEAISGNRCPSTLRVHIVLGEPGPHTARLKHMIEFMCRRGGRRLMETPIRMAYSVTVHPLLAEDFLTVYERERLFDSVV